MLKREMRFLFARGDLEAYKGGGEHSFFFLIFVGVPSIPFFLDLCYFLARTCFWRFLCGVTLFHSPFFLLLVSWTSSMFVCRGRWPSLVVCFSPSLVVRVLGSSLWFLS